MRAIYNKSCVFFATRIGEENDKTEYCNNVCGDAAADFDSDNAAVLIRQSS